MFVLPRSTPICFGCFPDLAWLLTNNGHGFWQAATPIRVFAMKTHEIFWRVSTAAFHWPAGFDQRFVTARERMDVAVIHFLRRVAGEDRTKSTAAIHDDFRIRIGEHFFQIALQDSLAKMHGFDGMICL